MKNVIKIVWVAILAAAITLSACGKKSGGEKSVNSTDALNTNLDKQPASGQQYNAEEDFSVKVLDGGKGVAITDYKGSKFEVNIPPKIQNLPVISIGSSMSMSDAAFDGKNITSVTIPSSVTSIGTLAFRDCKGLTSITIPASVTTIGWAAFKDCTGLTSVTIPNSVTSISKEAFSGTGLTSITIPASVTEIGEDVFLRCHSLTSVTFQGTIPSIHNRAFINNGDLQTKYLAGGPGTYIADYPVSTVELPDGKSFNVIGSPVWTKQ